MRILLDFDGTLCPDPCSRPPVSAPDEEAVAILHRIKEAGHHITILTCRAHESAPGGWRARHTIREITSYLRHHDIPFDEILTTKTHYDVLIDERALPYEGNWSRLARYFRVALKS